ncbi:MAG TPA: DinB family protein [Acidimicrobiales bacterium]|nr:DinB family protein [Acidimicrobiales bacterium]
MDIARRQELITRYRDGHRVVVEALAGATDDELDRIPEPGEWSARQVVHHLADSETTSYLRLRRLVAEDNPAIPGYDENLFARRLHYEARPVATSLDVLQAVRASTAELLDHLSDDEWNREGTHAESGAYSVAIWLETYAAHAHDHADQIRRALGRGE